VLVFPAHCTHLLQPLDVGIFNHFKHAYTQEVQRILVEREITKNDIGHLVSVGRMAVTTGVITKAWAESGAFPIDRDRVLRSGKLSTSLPHALVPDTFTILPSFSEKYRDKVEHVIQVAGAKLRLPGQTASTAALFDIQAKYEAIPPHRRVWAAVQGAMTLAEPPVPFAPSVVPQPATEVPPPAPAPAPPALSVEGAALVSQFDELASKIAGDKSASALVQKMRDDFVALQAQILTERTNRAAPKKPTKNGKRSRGVRSNGKCLVLTAPNSNENGSNPNVPHGGSVGPVVAAATASAMSLSPMEGVVQALVIK